MEFPIKFQGYVVENRASREDVERLENAWREKHRNNSDFLQARDVDHLLVPYECTTCIFRKLKGRDPILINPQDVLLQECIIRAVSDSFWSQASG